jgi:hypothetical protein
MAELFTLGNLVTIQVPGTVPLDNWSELAVADLDGNGHDDFIMTRGYYAQEPAPAVARQGFVVLGTEAGYSLATEPQFAISGLWNVQARELAFADLNEDGFLDVFIADTGYDVPPFPGQQNLLFLSEATPGSATWAAGTLPVVSDFTHSATIGDVNSDGHLDILAGNGGISSSYFLLGDGTGQFTQTIDPLPTRPGGALADGPHVGFTACLLVDLDLDGWQDLVLGTHVDFSAHQMFWSDQGSFAQTAGLPLPAPQFGPEWSIMDIQSTDANFDGLPDLLVSYQAEWNEGWLLQVLINQGDRTFADESTTYLPDATARSGGLPASGGHHAWVEFLVPRDVNGDGRTDFVVASRTGGPYPVPESFPQVLIH